MSDCKIDEIAPHTIKKIELVTEYVKTWAQKLLNNPYCKKLVFIDCMCNCGEYVEKQAPNNQIMGTAFLVAKYLHEIASNYRSKNIYVILNDKSENRISHLKSLLSSNKISNEENFDCVIKNQDCSILLEKFSGWLNSQNDTHFLLFYDPYQAIVNWEYLAPFFNQWGELIINHMVSDTIRSVKNVKSENTMNKYASTYLTEFQDLLPCGTDVKAYEELFERNIRYFRTNKREYYVSFFPFFNSKNALVYDLVHCTSNIEGFKLYKKCAWQVFDGQSSGKTRHESDNQLTLFINEHGTQRNTDGRCFTLDDVVDFIIRKFSPREDVLKSEIWNMLDHHPVFPSDGFKEKLSKMLKEKGYDVKRSSISFNRKNK